jgi:tetratricopeptide (TPR) repeat protein/TolB-like protein
MTAPAAQAVFLSYASQDAEAVKRICDALRAEGVEVWFDQDELVGGDAWDAKIRGQIGSCALFVPVISANTQARLEGYFRLEWKIAAQRTHTMAEEKAFLLPVVIDDTRDAAAKVPAEFKAVQWTRLPGGETTPAFRARVRKLLAGDATWTQEPAPGPAPATRSGRKGIGAWIGYGWAALGIGLGLFYATQSFWRGSRTREATPPAAAAPAPSPVPAPAPVPVAPRLDAQHVLLTRFENLTGDPALDPLARVVEAELVRNFAQARSARVEPAEVAGRTAGRAAARAAGAATVVVGSFLRAGGQVEVSAQVVLTEQGEVFGNAGPVVVPPAAARSEALTELAERLTTGVSNAVVTLQNPPTRIAAAIYTRTWPRHPLVARIAAVRARPADQWREAAAEYRALLAEAPEVLRVKHDLARLLRDNSQIDEAQRLFSELLRQDRAQLSEWEILGIEYDDALLAGDPNRALGAARAMLDLRPRGDAISQVVACLWGLNRPAAAYQELNAWWERHRDSVPAANVGSSLGGVLATKALMELQRKEPEQALRTLDEMERALAGQPFAALPWMRFAALGALGREEEQQRIVAEMSTASGAARIDPTALQWSGYQQALHLGRPEAAARWLAALERANAEFERTGQHPPGFEAALMWLHDASGRPEAALQVLARIVERRGETVNSVGSRAILLRALGRTAEAEAEERRLDRWERRNSRGLQAYWRARIAARAGDRERAVELLREAVAGGLWFGGFNSPTFEFGRSEPEFAKLRGYAPYEELLRPKD